MATPIYVNQSTTLVQVDTSILQEHIIRLSSLNTPGSIVTIRDITGDASSVNPITISTTQGVKFLDGGGINNNIYRITQPYGFITITPKTSMVWGVLNTYGFPDISAAANINNVTANSITVNNSYLDNARISTALISSLSTDYVFVRGNISVGQSTIAHAGFYTCTLRSLDDMITSGTLYAGSTISSMFGNITSTLTVPYISTQNIEIYGLLRSASTISTMGPLFVGSSISTTGDLAVGGSTFIQGELKVLQNVTFQSSLSTLYSLGVGRETQLYSSLSVRHDILTNANLSTMLNLNVGGALSVMKTAFFTDQVSTQSNLTVGGALSVMSTFYTYGDALLNSSLSVRASVSTLSNVYIASTLSVGGNLVVYGDVSFNTKVLNISSLSIARDLFVNNTISTYSSIAAGQFLRIMGSTFLMGPVSTLSNMDVGGGISTMKDLSVTGVGYFASNVLIQSSLSTIGNMNVFGFISTLSSVNIGHNLDVNCDLLVRSSLNVLGSTLLQSSVYIIGSLSVFSSIAVSCNLDIGNLLTVKNMGSQILQTSTFSVLQQSNFVMNISSSTLHYGLFSTFGAINAGGPISTMNTLAVGLTIDTQFISIRQNQSTIGNVGVGSNMFVLNDIQSGASTIVNGGFYTNNQAFFKDSVEMKSLKITSGGAEIFGSTRVWGETVVENKVTSKGGLVVLNTVFGGTGLVGIGKTDPVCALDVAGTINTNGGSISLIANQLNNLLGAPMDGIGYYNEKLSGFSGFPLKFGGFMGTIFSSGNGGGLSYPYSMVVKDGMVGVGVKNPTAKFQVIGNTNTTTVGGLILPATITNAGEFLNTVLSVLDCCTYNNPTAVTMEIGSANASVGDFNTVYKYVLGTSFTGAAKDGDFIIQAAGVGAAFNVYTLETILKLNRSQLAIGNAAGVIAQKLNAIAIGTSAGYNTQGTHAIAIGVNAGQTNQGIYTVAIGVNAGYSGQADNAIAIGSAAGQIGQLGNSVAIGTNAGQTSQKANSIAIGINAAYSSQGANAIALGENAGRTTQGDKAVAIGTGAGSNIQGANSIAIGNLAGETNQAANSIILNADGVALNSGTSGFFVKPIRNVQGSTSLMYNSSGEITHGTPLNTSGINSSGNIGINKAAGTFTLDVNGTLNTSGAATFNGNVTAPSATFTGIMDVNTTNVKITPRAIIPNGISYLDAPNTDAINGAPAYGIGYTNVGLLTVNGNTVLQIAGWTGISFIAGNSGNIWANGESTMFIYNRSVGIGTVQPACKLDVAGTIRSYRNGTSTSLNTQSGENYDNLVLRSDIDIGNSGKTSIIFASGRKDGYYARICGVDQSGTTGPWYGGLFFQTTSNGVMYDRMAIDYLGNVGIGIPNPSYKLDVNGTFNTSGAASFNGFVSAKAGLDVPGTGTLSCAGNANFNANGAGTVTVGPSSGTSSKLLVYGAVGIGKTSPVCALDVAGTINVGTGGNGAISFYPTQLNNLLGAPMDGIGYYNETLPGFTGYPLKIGGFMGTVLSSGNGGGLSYPYSMVVKDGTVGVGVKNPTAKFQVIGNTNTTTVGSLILPATITWPGEFLNTVFSVLDYCTYANQTSVTMEIGSANASVGNFNSVYKYVLGVSFGNAITGGDFVINAAGVGASYSTYTLENLLKLNRTGLKITGSIISSKDANFTNVTTSSGEGYDNVVLRSDKGMEAGGKTSIVFGSSTSIGLYARIFAEDTTVSGQAWGGSLSFQTTRLALSGSFATAMTINNAGNVGIGTITPAYALDVTGDIRATGNVTAFSDIRKKENILTIDSPLDKIMKMRGVYYTRKDTSDSVKRQIGVIAQEIEDILPEVVMTDDSEEKIKSVAYGNIVALLIEGMKAQQSTINSLLKTLNI